MKFDVTEMPDRKPVQFPLLCGNQFERRQRRGPRLLWKSGNSGNQKYSKCKCVLNDQIDSMLKTLRKNWAQAVEIAKTVNPPNEYSMQWLRFFSFAKTFNIISMQKKHFDIWTFHKFSNSCDASITKCLVIGVCPQVKLILLWNLSSDPLI